MQAGNLVGGDVLSFSTRILVNGVQRYGAWSTGRELSGDLPAQVVAVSGITQATGSINWFTEKDVAERPMQPWNPDGWFPAAADRVEIFVSDGSSEWKVFHGLIDKTSGSLGDSFQSTLIDDHDRLSVEVNHEALLSVMPPQSFDGSGSYRVVGLHPLYFVDYALRAAGFYATPPREPGTALDAPLQGSLWPNRGVVRSTGTSSGFNNVAPWGLARRDFLIEYQPDQTNVMSHNTQAVMMVAPDHTGVVDMFLDYGSRADNLRLHVSSSRLAIAFKNGVEVCRLSMGSATVISMLAKNGTLSLRTNNGATASGAFTASGGTMTGIVVNASANASVAGLQVSYPTSSEHQSTYWSPSARYDCTSLRLAGIIDASPTIENRTAGEVLEEINGALLAGMWIDETGVMQWALSDTLRMKDSARTVTTLDDVLSLDWEDGLLSSTSYVTLTSKQTAISLSRWRNTVLAQGSGENLKSGDTAQIFLEAEADEDWIMPGYNFLEVGGTVGIWSSANNPAYSLVGLYFSTDGGDTELTGLPCTITTTQLGLQKALFKYTAGSWASDVEGVISTSPTAATLWPKNRDKGLPKIVGMGRVRWTDETLAAVGPGGAGREILHDAGHWVNYSGNKITRDNIAQYISEQTTAPQPTIPGLSIVPDPRLQLGDVITVNSDLIDASLKVLVTSVDMSFDSSGLSMELGVRVISANKTSLTYEEWYALGVTPVTYTAFNSVAPTPQTYTQFESDI